MSKRRTNIIIDSESSDDASIQESETTATPAQIPESSSSSSSEDPTKSDCNTLVEKYTDLLLTDQQNKQVMDGINFFYKKLEVHKKQKRNVCVLCGKNSANTTKRSPFISSYNDTTYCKTIEIKCPAATPCKGWKMVFGVVFNLENLVRNQKKHIEELKKSIILNKNDMMYGYKNQDDAIEYHETMVAQLTALTDTYSTRLHKYLSYASNNRMKEDMDKISKQIVLLTTEIKKNVYNQNYKEAVNASLQIKADSVCLNKLKSIQENSYKEYLFNCESQFMLDEARITDEQEERTTERKRVKRTTKKIMTAEEKKLQKENRALGKGRKMIDKEIQDTYDAIDIMEEMSSTVPDFLESTISDFKKLKTKVKKYGNESQQEEVETLNNMLTQRLEDKKQKQREKEEEEHQKISNMLNSSEEVPKELIEKDMIELF